MDVSAWLRGLGLEHYTPAFRDNDINTEILHKLTADDLISIGVTSVGHRRKLLAAIAALGAEPTRESRSCRHAYGHRPISIAAAAPLQRLHLRPFSPRRSSLAGLLRQRASPQPRPIPGATSHDGARHSGHGHSNPLNSSKGNSSKGGLEPHPMPASRRVDRWHTRASRTPPGANLSAADISCGRSATPM